MTTLVHTRSTVAVNRSLSDLSFRAILRRLKVPTSRTDNPPDGAHQPRTVRVHGTALTTRLAATASRESRDPEIVHRLGRPAGCGDAIDGAAAQPRTRPPPGRGAD